MLTVAGSPTPASRSTRARAARVAAFRPTARVAQPALVLVTVAIAAIPLLVTVVRSGDDVTIPLVLLCLAAGASLGWAVDDPASDMLGPLPIDGPFRLRLRLAIATGLVGLVVTAAAIVLEAVGPGLPADARARLAETACAAAVAISIGLIAVRTGNRAAGAGAVTAGLLVPAVIAAFAIRLPAALPTFIMNPVHHRWWWLAAAGGALVVRLATTEPR